MFSSWQNVQKCLWICLGEKIEADSSVGYLSITILCVSQCATFNGSILPIQAGEDLQNHDIVLHNRQEEHNALSGFTLWPCFEHRIVKGLACANYGNEANQIEAMESKIEDWKIEKWMAFCTFPSPPELVLNWYSLSLNTAGAFLSEIVLHPLIDGHQHATTDY